MGSVSGSVWMKLAFAGMLGALALSAVAQSGGQSEATIDSSATAKGLTRWSAKQIDTEAAQMLAQARNSKGGSESVTLGSYPGHKTMLTVRTRSGGGEMHADWNDIFIVLGGEATEVTGGHLVDAKAGSSGETRGSRVEGGESTAMRPGDVIHIAPDTPHQTLVAPGKTFTYFVIKVAAMPSQQP